MSDGRDVVVVGGRVVVVVGCGCVVVVVLVDVVDVVVLLGGSVVVVDGGSVDVVVVDGSIVVVVDGSSMNLGLPTVVDVVPGRAGPMRAGLSGEVAGAVSSSRPAPSGGTTGSAGAPA
ncbi:MAG: hypothetical protein ACRDYF_12630, partial [Acidimicrobiia bacterium]